MKNMITLIALLCISYQNINAQLQIDDIKIDTNISGFHFTADYDGALIYTPNGQADIGVVKNPSAFSVSILTNTDYESAKDKIEELIEMSSLHDGNTQDQIVRKDTMVQGFKAYTVSLRESGRGGGNHECRRDNELLSDVLIHKLFFFLCRPKGG